MKDNFIYDIYYVKYPYSFRFGSYHAILRSLTIASLVERLYKDSRLSNETYERLLRTRQLIRTLIYFGIDSVEAEQAIDIINGAHRNVVANNNDYLYVLSTFFLEPLRWNKEYELKIIAQHECNMLIKFWSDIGGRMNIYDIPVGLGQWLQFQAEYEGKFMSYSEAGSKLALKSLDELCRQAIPFGLRTIAKQLLLGTVDKSVKDCLQLPQSLLPIKMMLKVVNHFQLNFEPKRDIVGN